MTGEIEVLPKMSANHSQGPGILQHAWQALQLDPFWRAYLDAAITGTAAGPSIHLGIFIEPYLGFVLDGTKTVESRFSTRRTAPFQFVRRGDILLVKRSGGPIVGISVIADVWFYHLEPRSWRTIREKFATALRAESPEFWEERRSASFATLMRLKETRALPPLTFGKSDRRGWMVLRHSCQQLALYGDEE